MTWAQLHDALAAWPSYELAAPERTWLFWVLALLLAWGFARWFWGQSLALAAPVAGPRGAGWLRWLWSRKRPTDLRRRSARARR